MTVKETYKVRSIKREQTHEWLLYKHYAKRLPSIMFAFGLYGESDLVGVCTIGMPPVQMNYGSGIFERMKIDTYELTRLVINEGENKNALSYFVSQVLKQMPRPSCIVSFADPNNNHHGYIYQATNWIYTGLSQKGGKDKQWILEDREYHAKTITIEWMLKNGFSYNRSLNMTDNWKDNGGLIEENKLQKHRYLYLCGDKRELRKMNEDIIFNPLPYPKGDNKRYDNSYSTTQQAEMFK